MFTPSLHFDHFTPQFLMFTKKSTFSFLEFDFDLDLQVMINDLNDSSA